RLGSGHAPDDPVDLPVTGTAAGGARVLEERQVGAGRALLVGVEEGEDGRVAAGGALLVVVEEVVDGRIVLVDGLLDHAETERAGVELDVARRVPGDGGDVVDAFELHGDSLVVACSTI